MAAPNAADGTQSQFHIDPSLLPDEGNIIPLREDALDLRQHIDFSLTNGDLCDHWDFPHYKRLDGNVQVEHLETLYAWLEQVQLLYLHATDFGGEDWLYDNTRLNAHQHQHNGLYELRRNLQSHGGLVVDPRSDDGIDIEHDNRPHFLSKEEIHHLAYRIISQIQQQEGAVLGTFPQGRWWIAPPTEAIELPLVETPNPAPDTAQNGGEEGTSTTPKKSESLSSAELAKARAASYTVHWVCYTDTNHIAVIIRETETGHSWYFDSASRNSQDVEENHQAVLSGLHKWCRKHNISIPDGNRHRRVEVIPHDLSWTCGLHPIAHTLAFLRCGLLGWHEISRWMRPQGDEAKLKKMRHDLMKALELSMGYRPTRRAGAAGIPFPEHYDDDANLRMFRFPSYPSVGVNREDLHNCEEHPFTVELNHVDHQAILRENYRRVHVECHDGISIQDHQDDVEPFSYRVYAELHNGLLTMRNSAWLSSEQVHYHATRLITKVQESVGAILGPARAENQEWWIAPDCYVIKCQRNSDTDEEEDQQEHINALSEIGPDHKTFVVLGEATDRSKDGEKYLRAKYTVHWVHYRYKVDHWAVIVRESATNFAWYFDSMEDGRESRKHHAIRVFNEWLAKSGVTTVSASFLVPALEQADGWECGLHAAAHAMAFIRFGVLGWQALPNEAIVLDVLPTGSEDNATGLDPSGIPKRLCETMTSALHGLMGVAFQKSPTASQEDGNKTASNEATPSKSPDKTNTDSTGKSDSDSGNLNGEASGSQPSDAMGTSSQPPDDDLDGFDPIQRIDASFGKRPVPHPTFFNLVKYQQQGLGFRFPTYPSIPLEPHLVRSVRDTPYNNAMENPADDILDYAYLRVDRRCCDRVSFADSLNVYSAYHGIHNALVEMREDRFLESRGMYHLASRLISIVLGQTDANRSSHLGLWGEGKWWIVPPAFLIDVPYEATGHMDIPPTFSTWASNAESNVFASIMDGDPSTWEESFDRALYTVHFIHSHGPLHWTVIIRERETGRMWHFDSAGDAIARERVFNGAVDRLTAWLSRCGKEIPASSCAYNVPTPKQDQGWECSFHVIANAMAFLRFGILGWGKLKCIALETDETPPNPTSTVNSATLRETTRQSLHGIFGLIMKNDDKKVDKHVKEIQREMADQSVVIREAKASHGLDNLVGGSPNQKRLGEEERATRQPREQKRKEKESRGRQTQGQQTQEPQVVEESEADVSINHESLVNAFNAIPEKSTIAEADKSSIQEPQTPERQVESSHNNSMSGLSPANRLFDEFRNNSSFMCDVADDCENVLAAQKHKRIQKKKGAGQYMFQDVLRKTYIDGRKKESQQGEKKGSTQEEEERKKKKAQEARDKEEQEKQNQQQQVASKSCKRGAPDDDDDDSSDPDSSDRSPKRTKQTSEGNPKKTPKKTPTPEKIPTPERSSEENPSQSPKKKRKTPPPDAAAEPQPAKRARREPTPAPKAPVRQSERQRKVQEAAVATQPAPVAPAAPAAEAPADVVADDEEEATEIEESGVEVGAVDEPAWLAERRDNFERMSKAQLIEQCRRRRLAGPPVDRVKTLAYSGYNRLDLVGRLLWYGDPAGMQVALDGRSLGDFDLEELKELCKRFELFYGGTDEEKMRQRLRWFFDEQQWFVQTLIDAEEIPGNWQDLQVPMEDAEEDAED